MITGLAVMPVNAGIHDFVLAAIKVGDPGKVVHAGIRRHDVPAHAT
ncbi:MAG TPA: hypothetical protein VFE41_24400 [Acetobacteraceae bacterium]|jgi:hypothetical protein|nr:hypothetical protein [Acetobacteraceae bacterium]